MIHAVRQFHGPEISISGKQMSADAGYSIFKNNLFNVILIGIPGNRVFSGVVGKLSLAAENHHPVFIQAPQNSVPILTLPDGLFVFPEDFRHQILKEILFLHHLRIRSCGWFLPIILSPLLVRDRLFP